MRRSHPLSDQLPKDHTGQELPYLGFPIDAVNLFGIQGQIKDFPLANTGAKKLDPIEREALENFFFLVEA